jgi:hypothetical protein
MELMNVAASSPPAATSHGNATTQDQHHHPNSNNNSTRSRPLPLPLTPSAIQMRSSTSSLDAAMGGSAAAAPRCLSKQVVQQQYSSNKMLQDQSYDPQSAAAAAAACHQVDSKKFSNTSSVSRSFPTEEELSESNVELKSCMEKLEVFVDLPHKLVIHMTCRPQLKFQSNMLQGMESLQLEVLQCNISRVAFGHVICIISAKVCTMHGPKLFFFFFTFCFSGVSSPSFMHVAFAQKDFVISCLLEELSNGILINYVLFKLLQTLAAVANAGQFQTALYYFGL